MSKHTLTTQNIETIDVGAPKHILNMQNNHHDAMIVQNTHYDQLSKLKKFHAHQKEDTTVAKVR